MASQIGKPVQKKYLTGKGTIFDAMKGNIANLDPTTIREDIYGSVQSTYDSLFAYTADTTSLVATVKNRSEGNIFVRSNGGSMATMEQRLFTPVKGSKIFSNLAYDAPSVFKEEEISVETQQMLLNSGIRVIYGTKIPDNPISPLKVGRKRLMATIHNTGIFSEIILSDDDKKLSAKLDQRYVVTTRVPDSFTYHYEKNKDDASIPASKKGRPQFERPIAIDDVTFEKELAKARYLSGIEPYIDNEEAKKFDHFTYWRYKNPNPANAFAGGFVHIFLTRPDLHLFDRGRTDIGLSLRADVMNDTDLYSLIGMHPETALNLVQKWQTGAMTDINLFLSNKCVGINIINDTIDENNFVEGFNRGKPPFGGRMDFTESDIDLTFNETQDLEVSNTMLLWMKYIHKTFTGELSPLLSSTSLPSSMLINWNHQHPMWRRLDSLASIYVIVTDMTQRNIIFWRKYFGVYPKSDSFSGLTASGDGKIVENIRKITISFKYTTYRSNNIVDLYAFNRLSSLDRALVSNDFRMTNNIYQTFDKTVATEHDIIAGIPFVAIEQHLQGIFGSYTKHLPRKMLNPQLLFSRTDGAFIPTTKAEFEENWVRKYWGSPLDQPLYQRPMYPGINDYPIHSI